MIAPEGITADGLDTAACILGPEKVALFESTPGAAALFVRITPKGRKSANRRAGPLRWTGRRSPRRSSPSARASIAREPGEVLDVRRGDRRPNPRAGRSSPPSRRGWRRRRGPRLRPSAGRFGGGSPRTRAACSRASIGNFEEFELLPDLRESSRAWRLHRHGSVPDALRNRRSALSQGATSCPDSCFRNSAGVSLRNSPKLSSGGLSPSRP